MTSNELVEALPNEGGQTSDSAVFTKPVLVGPELRANINCALGILQVQSDAWGDAKHYLLNSADGNREMWTKLGANAVLALTRKVLERNGVSLSFTFEIGDNRTKFVS